MGSAQGAERGVESSGHVRAVKRCRLGSAEGVLDAGAAGTEAVGAVCGFPGCACARHRMGSFQRAPLEVTRQQIAQTRPEVADLYEGTGEARVLRKGEREQKLVVERGCHQFRVGALDQDDGLAEAVQNRSDSQPAHGLADLRASDLHIDRAGAVGEMREVDGVAATIGEDRRFRPRHPFHQPAEQLSELADAVRDAALLARTFHRLVNVSVCRGSHAEDMDRSAPQCVEFVLERLRAPVVEEGCTQERFTLLLVGSVLGLDGEDGYEVHPEARGEGTEPPRPLRWVAQRRHETGIPQVLAADRHQAGFEPERQLPVVGLAILELNELLQHAAVTLDAGVGQVSLDPPRYGFEKPLGLGVPPRGVGGFDVSTLRVLLRRDDDEVAKDVQSLVEVDRSFEVGGDSLSRHVLAEVGWFKHVGQPQPGQRSSCQMHCSHPIQAADGPVAGAPRGKYPAPHPSQTYDVFGSFARCRLR